MRTSIGLGLVALVGLFACATDVADPLEDRHQPGSTSADGPETDTSTDPTRPAVPAASPMPEAPEAPPAPEVPPAPIVRGVAVTDIAVFQAVKVPVVSNGELVPTTARKAPVVANRMGMLRVYVKPDSSFTAREITAELRLLAEGKKFPIVRETKRITEASKDDDPTSTFNLELPAASLPPGVSFQVALTADDGDKADMIQKSPGRYPNDGTFESLGAEVAGKLRLVVVPVQYDADGSGRTPAVGPSHLELYKKTMMRLYPASDVEVTARAPYPWKSQISSDGNGFASILRAVTQLRQQDGVPKDVYYYGLLTPKASMSSYCPRGCVTGLSTVVDNPSNSALRASVGIGFGGQESANTMAHEVGHAHGREHAPCGGAQGIDPKFPYQGGAIGSWGYDIFAKTLISPAKGRDIMGYCPNEWISDYTYNALFERISAISVAKNISLPGLGTPSAAHKKPVQVRVATASASGDLTWDGDLDLDEEPAGGEIRLATFLAESDAQMVTRPAKFFRFDHLPGGFLFVPKDIGVDAATWKAIRVEGFANKLAR